MGKAFLGFVIGVALTSFAFVLLDSAPEPKATPAVATRATGHDVVQTSQGDDDQHCETVSPAAAEPQVEVTVPSAQDLYASVTDDISGEVELFLGACLREGMEMADKLVAARPVLLPSPLPTEFDWVSENAYADFFHESFQREVRDEAWASAAESELLKHISDQFEFIQKYGYPTVECRTTRCIVKFVGYGVDEDPRVATRELSAAMREYQESSELVGCVMKPFELCVSDAHSAGGITTIYWGIRRNQE